MYFVSFRTLTNIPIIFKATFVSTIVNLNDDQRRIYILVHRSVIMYHCSYWAFYELNVNLYSMFQNKSTEYVQRDANRFI